MKKILIITSGLTAGGVDSLILNVLAEMDRKRFCIDFLIFEDSKDDWEYKFKAYGCKVYKIQRARKAGTISIIKQYKRIIKEGKYNIVHSHIGFGSVLPLIAVSQIKGCKIATHAHFDDYPVSKMTKALGHILFNVLPCKRLACSIGAGQALYGTKSCFDFVKNGIDTSRFSYNEAIRNEVRDELGIKEDQFVIGTVGRMEYQKNHDFLVDIFEIIHRSLPNSELVLIGDGSLKDEIHKKLEDKKLTECTRFLGIRNDVDKLLQALDVFIMPTRFEGLSLALLEVEASGLPCLTSDVVPAEAKVVENFHFLSLKEGPDIWAKQAMQYYKQIRSDGSTSVREAGFDKKDVALSWFRIYENL